MSAIVLAGGFSKRMGRDKAELPLGGCSLIELQVRKFRDLGVRDIMLSGYPKPLAGCRNIEDVYPHRGPVSGIHACLQAAENEACFALSVDMPLLPEEVLLTLAEAHCGGITVLEHGGKPEPLAAVYDRALYPEAEKILHSERTALMKMLDFAEVTRVPYTGDEFFLTNCNTPEEYEKIRAYWREP